MGVKKTTSRRVGCVMCGLPRSQIGTKFLRVDRYKLLCAGCVATCMSCLREARGQGRDSRRQSRRKSRIGSGTEERHSVSRGREPSCVICEFRWSELSTTAVQFAAHWLLCYDCGSNCVRALRESRAEL